MITIRIKNRMYDITERCPKCGKEEVFLSRYGHRIICGFCGSWKFTDEAVNTPWVKESLAEIRCGDEQGASDDVGTSVADAIRNMDNNTLAIYLHSWQTENMSVEQIKETLRLPLVKCEE